MAPTLEQSYKEGITPLLVNEMSEEEFFSRIVKPVHGIMIDHVREQDLKLFLDIAKTLASETADKAPHRSLIPAFMIRELLRGFEIGFLIFVPFLVINMVDASVLMSMSMMMLPPIMISLPFKLIFFVLVDGWYLVAGSLIRSYGGG